MNTQETISTFTEFFRDRGHQPIPGSSLLSRPGDPVLFTSAGMHPLTPYFAEDLRSARSARQFVTGELSGRVGEPTIADATTVIGELAANAVLHAHSPFTVTVSYRPAGVRIAVRDTTPLNGTPLPVRDGHGLHVVSQLATDWSVDPLPGGKVIWADLG